MLVELVSGLALLTLQQQTPPRPAADAAPARVGDVVIDWRPETLLCVRGERPEGSRIQSNGECRTMAAWKEIQIARADRYVILRNEGGAYVVNSGLEEEAISRGVQTRLQAGRRR